MQNSNFEDNLRFFKDILPYSVFYELLKNKNKFNEIEILESNDDIKIQFADKTILELKIEVEKPNKSKIAVFTSFLSYLVFINKINPEPELSIIFPEDLYHLGNIMFSLNLQKYIKSKNNIFFIFNKCDIDNIINLITLNLNLLQEKILNFRIEKYDSNITQVNKSIFETFSFKLNDLLIDYSTHQIMLPKQIFNGIENIKHINNTIEINPDKNSTCIVVSAGPSLNESINTIKRLKDISYIISVDTAFKFLLKNEIVPDLVIALDPQILNYLDFIGIKELKNTILAIEISSSFKIAEKFKNYNNIGFFAGLLPVASNEKEFYPSNQFSEYISELFSLFKFPVYGNVGLAAISLASLITDNLILAGFDNSFQSLIYHCKETIDIDFYLKKSNFLFPSLSSLTKEALFKIDEPNLRTSSLLKRNLSLFQLYFPHIKFHNINELSGNKDYFNALNKNGSKFVKLKKIEKKDIIFNNELNNELKNELKNKLKNELINKFIINIDKSFNFFPQSKQKSYKRIIKSLDRLIIESEK